MLRRNLGFAVPLFVLFGAVVVFMRQTHLPRSPTLPVAAPAAKAVVVTGLENLMRQDFAPLQGKRIGLVTNPTGVASDLRTDIAILSHANGVKLAALFGPEHGVRGDASAGEAVGNARDAETGLPVYSLYGKTRKPTPEMLRGIDTLVFDIQDIGARSYTYISTLGLCMEAAADARIPIMVLDRPNPLNGERIEGNIPTPDYFSFVGRYPIPYAHGLTVGELAQMMNGEGWLNGRHCDLTVIPMRNWKREMDWNATGLPWVPSSPHIPHAQTALYYVSTGIVGNQPALSIGVGYTLPFEMAGAPGISPEKMARELNGKRLPGVTFRPASWVPFYAGYKDETCGGVQIYFTDPNRAPLTRLNFEIMEVAKRLKPSLNFFPAGRERSFDLVCGTDAVRKMLQAGKPASEVWKKWDADSERFRKQRRPYLIYP